MTSRNRRGKTETPELYHLDSEDDRALVIQIRREVEPILANNILHHFTDHTVAHSDNLCGLVDELIKEVQETDKALNHDELIVLYSACYLHDLGMQYENAGQTRVIRSLCLSPSWEEIDERERRELLRQRHHEISAELIAESVGMGTCPIGIQLSSAHHPAQIARLCEAHCVTPGTPRYAELMSEVPGLRMPLLSGLLRLADILDESRRRACREKAGTLLLNLESQTHWWRQYFTKGVKISPEDKTLTLWFEFPKDLVDEYQRIIPELQVPWIEQELSYHREAFSHAGMAWTLQLKTETGPYCNVEQMPHSVVMEMLKQLRLRRLGEEQRSREIALRTFKEARPHVRRQLAQLRDRKSTIPLEDYISDLASLAVDLWEIGSHRSACMALECEFHQSYPSLGVEKRVEIGIRLLRMLMGDDKPEMARGWVQQFNRDVTDLPCDDPQKARGLQVLAEWYLQMCGYDEAITAFEKARAIAKTLNDSTELSAQVREMHFLQGELEKALDETDKTG